MPNDNVIDNLSIQVKTEAQSASTVIDGLATRLTNLSNVLKGFTKKKINIGVNAEQVEILRQFANTIEDLNFAKLNAFANLTQQIKKVNIGLKGDDGTNMSMFAMGLEDLNIEKFRQYAEVSKDVAKISLGIGDKSGAGFSTFVDSLNRADTGKMQAFADAFRDFGGVHIGFQQAGVESLAGFVVAMNSADMDKMTQFADAFREFGGVHIGITEKGADAFKAFADASSSLSEPALEKLRSLSSIDFSNLKPLADAAQGMKALTNATEANAPATEKAEKAQKKLATATRSVRHATHRAHHTFNLTNNALGKLFNSIKRIAFYRMIRSAIKAVTQGFGEGIENLYRWSQAWGTSFAPAMDQLKTAQTYLKNGFASMFSPLIEYAIPIIDRVVDRLVDMFNAVQELFAQLTGAATWNKAIKYPVKYKEDLDDAGKSAKALQNILMDFDEINAINTPNTSGGSSGKEHDDYSKMFELVETSTESNSALKKFIDYIKSLNFEPLRKSLQSLWNDGLSPIISYFAENGGKFLSPLVKFFVEEGLPTAINLVTAALKPFLSLIQPLLDSGFFEDVAGKLSKVNDTVQKLADFIGQLDFEPLGQALSSLWNNTLSPMIDKLIEYSDWITEHVIEPITEFLVEKGIPAAINAVESALSALWSILEPILDGLKTFWDENGEWIMEMLEEHTMTALDKIKGLFEKLGNFFTKNGDKIRSIFANISKVVKDLSPLIKWLAGALGTHAWDTFVDSIMTILDAVQPVLDLLSGILNLLTAAGDMEKAKKGLGEIGQAIWDALVAPFNMALRGIATFLDAIGQSEAAYKIRVFIGDEVEEVNEEIQEATRSTTKFYKEVDEAGNYVSYTGAKISAAQDEINQKRAEEIQKTQAIIDNNEQVADQMVKYGYTSAEVMAEVTEWYNYCEEQGLDPLTGKIIFAGEKTAELSASINALPDSKTVEVKLNADEAKKILDDLKLRATNLNASLSPVQTVPKWVNNNSPLQSFASGGFPTPSSLFWAGEGGVPELMGTVGGRTAVAGGHEITGIREAIEARGAREEGLLRQLISAVANKDLTLVANSNTGRWVNKALKAYTGVTG